MQRKFFRKGGALLFALTLFFLFPGALAQDAAPVTFSDADFARLLATALGKGAGAAITAQDLEGIQSLGIYGDVLIIGEKDVEPPEFFMMGSFASLPDLELFPALTKLAIWYQPMETLEDLQSLKGLTKLSLAGLPASDVTPLSGLTALTDLTVRDTQLSDIHPLSSLVELTRLSLWNNQIASLSGIETLQKLLYFAAWNNQISDIGPLGQLPELAELDLYRNQISDVSPLAESTALRCLSLGQNPIHDISSLSKLRRLGNLYITYDGAEITSANIHRILPNVYVAE